MHTSKTDLNGTPTTESRKKKLISQRKVSWSLEMAVKPNGYSPRFSIPPGSICTANSELMPLSSLGNTNRQAISQRTTKMLVICSTTFLLFNSPYCAVLCYCIISKVVLTDALGILRHFYFMSFCLNFFLYSLCGYRFRQEFIILLKTGIEKCLPKNTRLPWSRVEKMSNQSNLTRGLTRTAI